MSIHFSPDQWEQVRHSYRGWWDGTLKRPLVKTAVRCHSPNRHAPKVPFPEQDNCHDFSIPAEAVIDAVDYELSQFEFMGDSFPQMNFSYFGPGVLAAFCGAKLDNSSGRVWFFPQEKKPIEEISIRYDPQNPWVLRIKDLYRAGMERWNGNVLMGMPDLGGIMDVVASFRESEQLLFDLYDAPEEVLRLCKEAHTAWMEAYRDLRAVLDQKNPGYSDWSGVYSELPSYILQCDFCYMLGNPMFREFVLPDIIQGCRNLSNTIYHLDGIGQLNHLDDILNIPELNAVQWVYGDGQPTAPHWLEIYRKISAAGKGIYLNCNRSDFEIVQREVPNGRYFIQLGASTPEEARQMLKELGVLQN
ncbi:MAG: hypothetical protein ACOX6P_01360 [Candidatus Merdivicinus sp.]|jgi:hypothetical protein